MKRIMIGVALMGIGLSQAATTVRPARMNCEDFVALADNYKPALLYWAAGVDRIDVKATDELVVDAANPVGLVVDECRKTPKTSFMSKVRQLTSSGKLSVTNNHDHD